MINHEEVSLMDLMVNGFPGKALIAGLMLLALSGCGQGSKSNTPTPPPEVAVVELNPERVVITTELAGRTSANLVAEVRPQVGGIIQKRFFTEGSDVKAGQVLFQVDPAPFKAALDNARASLSKAEANVTSISSQG